MVITGILDRRIRGRLALMGVTQAQFCEQIEVSYVGFRKWMLMDHLPDGARTRLASGLGVDERWLDSQSLEDAGSGLNLLCKESYPETPKTLN